LGTTHVARAATQPGLGTPSPARSSPADSILTLLIVAGGFAIVLAGVRSEIFDLERHSVPKALALHAVAFASLTLLLRSWRRIELGAVEAFFLAFLAWSAVSAVLAVNRWLAFQGFGLSASGFVVYLASRRAARRHRHLIIGGLAAAAVLGGAAGIAQAYGADWSWLARTRPPGATFGNRNFLAHFLAIATPLLLLVTLGARRRPSMALGLIGLAVLSAAILLTRSRAAWLGVSAALTVMTIAALARRHPRRPTAAAARLVSALAALALGAAAAVVLPNRLEWRSDSPYVDTLTRLADYRAGSGRGRLIQYRNSLRLLPEHPVFGVGPGNWFVHYPRVTTPGDPAFHAANPIPTNPWPSSDWVALLVERGPIAVLLVLFAGGAAALTAIRTLRSDDRDAALRAAALLGTFAAITVTGAFDAVLLLPAPTYLAAAAAGALLPPGRPLLSVPLASWPRRVTALAALALAAASALTTAGQLRSILLTQRSTGRATIERALRLDPGNHRLHLRLARSGPCSARIPHARAAARLMPYHPAPPRALRACGASTRPQTRPTRSESGQRTGRTTPAPPHARASSRRNASTAAHPSAASSARTADHVSTYPINLPSVHS
jgi:hypothetical protein